MVVPKDFTLPSNEELTVEEINVSYPVLHAASFYVGKKCELDNNVSSFVFIVNVPRPP